MKNSTKIPSKVYKNVIINGAKQNGLPDEYITKLENLPDNGYGNDLNDVMGQLTKETLWPQKRNKT